MKRSGFTLIEIMISLAIFLTLMGMIGNVFFRTSRITNQSLAMLELFQKAESINKHLEYDFLSLQQTCALHYDETNRALTFMAAKPHDPAQDGDFFTQEKWHGNDLEWIRWRWNPTTGVVDRGNSRTSTIKKVQLIVNRDISSRKIHENNRRAIPQRDYLYFVGRGNVYTGTTFNGPYASKQQIFENFTAVSANQPGSGHADIRFRLEDAFENVRTLGVLGDADPVDNVYAVRNPDGRTYNKDYANLIGDSDDKYYPNQIAPLSEDTEFFHIELLKRDGITPIASADDDDTINDNGASNPTIDIKGIELNMRNPANQLAKRPAFVNIYYLLHDMPNDIPGVTTDNLLQELRDQVIADSSLTHSDIVVDLNNRRQALYGLIEFNGFNALIISKSIKLPH